MNIKKVEDGKEYRVLTIGNYYGGLSVKRTGFKFFWSIEDWDGVRWVEISKELFTMVIEQQVES